MGTPAFRPLVIVVSFCLVACAPSPLSESSAAPTIAPLIVETSSTPVAAQQDPTSSSRPYSRSAPVDEAHADLLRFGIDGIGTARLGEFRFGSDSEPVIDLLTLSLGIAPSAGTGRNELWFGEPDDPILRLVVSDDGSLEWFFLSLDALDASDAGPVVVGEGRIVTGPFELHERALTDSLIYMTNAAGGFAERCSLSVGCFYQDVLGSTGLGEVTGFGLVRGVGAALWTRRSTRVLWTVEASDGVVELRHNPSHSAEVVHVVTLEPGDTMAVIGDPFSVAHDGQWWQVVVPNRPLLPTLLANRDQIVVVKFG